MNIEADTRVLLKRSNFSLSDPVVARFRGEYFVGHVLMEQVGAPVTIMMFNGTNPTEAVMGTKGN